MRKKDEIFICKDCKTEQRVGATTEMLADMQLCPQCYTRQMQLTPEKMLKHTQTPWEVETYMFGPHKFGIGTGTGDVIFNELTPLTKEDAHFICIAVNAYVQDREVIRELKQQGQNLAARLAHEAKGLDHMGALMDWEAAVRKADQ